MGFSFTLVIFQALFLDLHDCVTLHGCKDSNVVTLTMSTSQQQTLSVLREAAVNNQVILNIQSRRIAAVVVSHSTQQPNRWYSRLFVTSTHVNY